MAENNSKFSLGLVLGALGGALAALFLTPTTGGQNRQKALEAIEKIKKIANDGELEGKAREIFGEVTDEGKRLLAQTQKEIEAGYAELKNQIQGFDRVKFEQFVNTTISRVNESVQAGSDVVSKLKTNLIAKWGSDESKLDVAREELKPKIDAEKIV